VHDLERVDVHAVQAAGVDRAHGRAVGHDTGRVRQDPAGAAEQVVEWGKSEPDQFCASIAQSTEVLFRKARRAFAWCRDGGGSPQPEVEALCTRELARLPQAKD
jgi:hypothetical protein